MNSHNPTHGHSDDAPGQNKTVNIIVNGRPKTVTGKTLSYREVVQLAYPNEQMTDQVEFTVAYANPHGQDGTLVDGQDVHVKEGMVFNVRKTNRS